MHDIIGKGLSIDGTIILAIFLWVWSVVC